MFLLFGTRLSHSVINIVTFVCGNCRVQARQQVLKRVTRLTVFFIPLFPVSTSYVNVCDNCGFATRVTKAQAQHSLEWARSHASGAN